MLCRDRVVARVERLGLRKRLLCHDIGVDALCRYRDIMSQQGWMQDKFSSVSRQWGFSVALKSIATGAAHLASRHSLWCPDRACLAGGVATEHPRDRAQRSHDRTSARAIERAGRSNNAQCTSDNSQCAHDRPGVVYCAMHYLGSLFGTLCMDTVHGQCLWVFFKKKKKKDP